MSAIRQALERCYLQRNGDYTNCTAFANLDLANPGASPNAHFTYAINAATATGYAILATRNTRDGGSNASTITITQTSAAVTRAGAGAFAGIQ